VVYRHLCIEIFIHREERGGERRGEGREGWRRM
jgi:hypothetical protein